ncbi:MAG: hypothetical protein PW790_04635 [Parvibaculaceae bacterium]|nr:hypothetical protein [Parvibaculaceae bacterium]
MTRFGTLRVLPRDLFLAMALILCMLPIRVSAAPALDQAESAFAAGDFQQAASLARSQGGAAGYAFAARALIAYGDYVAPRDKACDIFRQAQSDARTALDLDPSFAPAHIYVAIALGFAARAEGGLAAHLQGLPGMAKMHIDRAIELNPGDPWAFAALGGWNLEISYAGGVFGEELYGASVKAGRNAYEKALQLDPQAVLIRYQYALQLAALGQAGMARDARVQLAAIIASSPHDAVERYTLAAARDLDRALASGKADAVQGIIHVRMGDPAILPDAGPANPKGMGQ